MKGAEIQKPMFAMVQLDLGSTELIRAEVLEVEDALFLGVKVALVKLGINDRPRWAKIVEILP